ncbi:MAG: DUF1638 domain-containing protein [Pseudomonadota bacterium]
MTLQTDSSDVLVIACGAIAHEVTALRRLNDWNHMRVQCLPADLHNRPDLIPAAVDECIARYDGEFQRIFVAYADCGTGGLLDEVLQARGVERIPGAHCYEFFAGASQFLELSDAEPGTFYLTDFLARNFERLILRGLGIEKHPELMSMYFGNYRRVVYLQQRPEVDRMHEARAAADRLGLEFEHRMTGFGTLEVALSQAVAFTPELSAVAK